MTAKAAPSEPKPGAIARARTAVRVASLVAFALLAACFAQGELVDDAFISFRYAQNWLDGHGLVFNPGERVEGYTNFAWTVLLAASARVGVEFELAARVLGAGFGILAVALCGVRRPGALAVPLPLAAALLGADPAFAMWSVHGLETAMFAALILAALHLDLSRDAPAPASAICWGAAALTRPEGVLLGVARACYGFAATPATWRGRRGLAWCAVFGAIVVTHVAWRAWFYGELVPNTFYAKVDGDSRAWLRGVDYLGDFFAHPGALVFSPALIALRRARTDRGLALVAFTLFVGLAAIVLEGGDVFVCWRFLVPLLPLLYLLSVAGAWQAWRGLGSRAARAGLVGFLSLAAGLHVHRSYEQASFESYGATLMTATYKQVGAALREALPADATIALNPAGAVPFVSGLRAIDMLGLNDREIARSGPSELPGLPHGHERGDGAAVLRRAPDVILMGNVHVVDVPPGDAVRFPPMFRSEYELMHSPELHRRYRSASLELPDGRFLLYLVRRDADG